MARWVGVIWELGQGERWTAFGLLPSDRQAERAEDANSILGARNEQRVSGDDLGVQRNHRWGQRHLQVGIEEWQLACAGEQTELHVWRRQAYGCTQQRRVD